jgi:glutaconate CoA-transferase, subunit B
MGEVRPDYTQDEMMTVTAARQLDDGQICFVGIGLPSEAANLARLTHAPNVVLIYESGTIGTRPDVLPLSIGDGELAERADLVVGVPEIFSYWLQAGRVDVGFLSAAQIDRHGNLNSTAIGPYQRPDVRLPGSGGAPEIATGAGKVVVMLRQSTRSFVHQVDFVTSPGFGPSREDRNQHWGQGPTVVITDVGVYEPDIDRGELMLVSTHPGVDAGTIRTRTGWDLAIASTVDTTMPPEPEELAVLRDLKHRTDLAHDMTRQPRGD